jgi:3-deoxy-manno-octulosonate cytidylyltransferase (CMP-KDO synthetase)
MPAIVGIIPARLGSTRLPGKVLLDRTGKPLIRHVYEAAARAKVLEKLVIATDDERVREAVEGFGGACVMTRVDHPNGTSRLAEAAQKLGLADDDIIVNVQGDEPDIDPEVIHAAVGALTASNAPVATVASPFQPGEDPTNPAIVKVVLRRAGGEGSGGVGQEAGQEAMYFSRSLIPHPRVAGVVAPLKHIGLYVYRHAFLRRYVAMAPTPLEQAESLEQLRVLENGHAIAVAVRSVSTTGIDTPEQYEAFVRRMVGR